MKIVKKGVLFAINNKGQYCKTHAQACAPIVLESLGLIRVFFSSRCSRGIARPFAIDLSLENPCTVIKFHSEPLMPLGDRGMFDEHGVMPSCVINVDGVLYLFYSGWQRQVGVPYSNYSGVAISEDFGLSFTRVRRSPVLDRSCFDLFSATSPEVVQIEPGVFRAFYSSGTDWIDIEGKAEHVYDIKVAESHNLIDWEQTGEVAIAQRQNEEAYCKPTFLRRENQLIMLVSRRSAVAFRGGSGSYSVVAYAGDGDYRNWIELSDENPVLAGTATVGDFDSTMAAYPSVFEVKGTNYLLYNGNGFGKSGIGLGVVDFG